jgi:uncharacterized protein YjbJ (UPF0337 family)
VSTLDKIAGKTKQLVAEIIGDSRLQREGKNQVRNAEQPKDSEKDSETADLDPLKRLNELS